MSDYTRVYNFTVKDGLPTGDSNKVIKGTEIDVELNAAASAISSKADINSPTFTGTPVAPTAAAATNTTQIATTAHVFAERTNTATLTNKTLTSPTLSTPTINNSTIATTAISDATVTGDITMASDDTGIKKGTASVKVDGTTSEVVLTTSSGTATLNSAGKLTNAGIVESTTGGFKFPDASIQTTAAVYSGIGGQVFTSSGYFTIPPNVTKVKVIVTGGGGNGDYTGGGGGGGTAIKWLSSLTPGYTLAVTVGGAATDSTVASGTQSISTLTGKAGGNASGQTGGTGGVATGGDLNIQGDGGIGPSGVVSDSATREGGAGGGSYWGGGARGANANGANGGNYGGGGSGYGYGNSTAGTGAAGVVVFEW